MTCGWKLLHFQAAVFRSVAIVEFLDGDTSHTGVVNPAVSRKRIHRRYFNHDYTKLIGFQKFQPIKKLLDAPVIDEKTCQNAYPGLITSRMMCIGFMDGGKDSCAGDGGGPAVAHGPMVNETWHMNGAYWVANHEGGHQLSRMTHGELQGIVSWGHKCGVKNRPGVYTKVCQFNDWIHGVMNSNWVPNCSN